MAPRFPTFSKSSLAWNPLPTRTSHPPSLVLARRMVNVQRPLAFSRRSPCSKDIRCTDLQGQSKLFSPHLRPRALSASNHAQVTFDLHQVDETNLPTLRDTLLTALEKYQAGPKSIITQICLALSGLALQLPAWSSPVQDLIERFGRNPATVSALLQFLTVMPEEICTNTRIPVTVRSLQSFAAWTL